MTELHPIDLTGFRPAAMRDQPQPMLMWVDVDQLVIDRRYQRSITQAGRRAIQRIADGFDWTKFEPILVAPTCDGRLAVVDGQHRAHAASLVGLKSVPAMSVPMTPDQQAAGFAAINRDRIRLSVVQIYRAELAAGTGWAVAARDAVESAGCHLATYTPTGTERRPHVIYGVGFIRQMVERGEAEAVTAGLRAIRDSEVVRDDSSQSAIEAYQGKVLRAWLPVVARSTRYLRHDLAPVFDEIDFEDLRDRLRPRARETGKPLTGLLQDAVEACLVRALAEAAA